MLYHPIISYSRLCLQGSSLCKLFEVSHAHIFNSTVMLILMFLLSLYCVCQRPVSCDLINLRMSLCKYFKRVDIFAFLQCLILKALLDLFQCGNHWQQYNTSLTVTQPNIHMILVNVVFFNHTAYCIGFCFRCYCTCRTLLKEITWFDY